MKRWMHKIEVIIDNLIPYMLALLLMLIIVELSFHEFALRHHTLILSLDYSVISIFFIDLIFKYIRVKNISEFIKKNWLDIIAIFPFFLMFRAFERIIILFSRTFTEGFSTAQTIVHESVAIEKEGSKIIKEINKIARISRTNKFTRFIRPLFRVPRFIKAIHFFEEPTGDHHPTEKQESQSNIDKLVD